MLLDETCLFLAVDFDKGGWLEDSAAYMETCRRVDVPAVLERSRSGRGGHVWLLFDEAEGAERARSASEAFLYRRLQTLRETCGRFQMNADLPIAFDGWGQNGGRSPLRRFAGCR